MKVSMISYFQIRSMKNSGKSERKISKETGHCRQTIAKYCDGDNYPGNRKTPERTSPIMTDDVIEFIEMCNGQDELEPNKKQHHTARHIYHRLVDELGFKGSESSVRRMVRIIRNKKKSAFIILQFEPGEAIQTDFGDVYITLKGEECSIVIYCARLCYSDKFVVIAYSHQNTESFLEGTIKTFHKIGGVPQRVIFDNAKVAVKSGSGKDAVPNDRFALVIAHYAFQADFCNARQGHEKGLVEGLVGLVKRTMFTPRPKVNSLEELNAYLEKKCEEYNNHHIPGKPDTVGAMFETEQSMLKKLPGCDVDIYPRISSIVHAYSVVIFQTNKYSVPVEYTCHHVGIKIYPEKIEVYEKGNIIACHNRLFGRYESSLKLIHYISLLTKKPRSCLNAAVIKQNLSHESYDELVKNYGNVEKMNEILCRESGLPREEWDRYIHPKKESQINDPISIDDVDLNKYDNLHSGGYEIEHI